MSKASALSKKFKKISDALEKRYGNYTHVEFEDFIEVMMYQILALGSSKEAASEALTAIHNEFVDWNDMRMSTVREIEDIIGDDYPRCREKAEDVINLLADLYTAFRKMDLNEVAPTEEGMSTLRALPETTLVRRDMVEHALNVVFNIPTFSCDELQFDILCLLGGLPKDTDMEEGLFQVSQALVDEEVSIEELRQLSHGLRCHADFLVQYNIHDPKPIGYGWDKADPLGMKVPTFKSEVQEIETIPPILPAPKPKFEFDDDDEDEEEDEVEKIDPDLDLLVVADDEYKGGNVQAVADGEESDIKDDDTANEAGDAADKADSEEPAVEAEPKEAPQAEPAKKKAAAKKSAAKKEPAKKKAAAKKEPAKKKAAAKKEPAKKKATAKKEPAKKKAAAKKEPAKKKAAAKKEPAKKKAAAKKEPAKKKAAAKKEPAKKKAAAKKKTAAKKSSAKKSSSNKKK